MADELYTYASAEELETYLEGAYTVPANVASLLRDASRLIDKVTLGLAPLEWADPLPDPVTNPQRDIGEAVCAQVEYWLELSPEYRINPTDPDMGMLKVQSSGELAPKARDILLREALLYRAAEVAW